MACTMLGVFAVNKEILVNALSFVTGARNDSFVC
jgi:hypothetical protein